MGSNDASAQAGTTQVPSDSRLLRALPSRDYQRLLPDLEPVSLPLKLVLYESRAEITHAYFPTSGMISLVNEMKDGTVEVGTVGNEGMVGTPVLLYTNSLPARVYVQLAGQGYRIAAGALLRVVRESPEAERLLFGYVQAVFDQLAQWVACNRLHALEARCARWLLMTSDRAGADQFLLTQEFLSYMLGVHRPAVSVAAGALSTAGLIRYSRGKVTVVNREGLESAACECYGITRQAIDRLLGAPESVTT